MSGAFQVCACSTSWGIDSCSLVGEQLFRGVGVVLRSSALVVSWCGGDNDLAPQTLGFGVAILGVDGYFSGERNDDCVVVIGDIFDKKVSHYILDVEVEIVLHFKCGFSEGISCRIEH